VVRARSSTLGSAHTPEEVEALKIVAKERIEAGLGFHDATGGDEVFRQFVLARIIEPTSKEDSVRVLEEVGVNATSYPTIKRRLPD
jgi:hypothetical protein